MWRRYPRRDSKGRVEWIHWADLDLAAAWAEQALRDLDAFVAKHSGPTASAAELEGGARAPITTEAFGVLRSLNNAFQALNVPPIVAPTSDEFGTVDLIRSFVVITSGRIVVRTQLMLGASRRGPTPAEEMAAFWRTLGARELASDEGVVVDVRGRRTVFRGGFEAALAFKRNAANADRAFLVLWARRPWTLVRAEDETEFVWSAPLVWERDRVVRKLELARPVMHAVRDDPWSALVSARAAIRLSNDALADEWSGQIPELSSMKSTDQVRRLQGVMESLAQARSDAALNQARAQAREGLATGAGSVAGVLGALSAVAPPAALILAPAAAVLSAIAAIAGLLLQLIPREWMATAEVLPPRMPLPYMTTGDEVESDSPSHSVPAPPRFARSVLNSDSAPVPLEPQPVHAVMTLQASTTPSRHSTMVPASMLSNPATKNLLLAGQPVHAAAPSNMHSPEPLHAATPQERSTSRAQNTARRNSSIGTGLVITSLSAGALLFWITSRD